MSAKKRGLGRGLGALIPQSPESEVAGVSEVPLESIEPNPYQPRQGADETIHELADSIREHGVIQPLIVTMADSEGGKRPERADLPRDPRLNKRVTGPKRLSAADKLGIPLEANSLRR